MRFGRYGIYFTPPPGGFADAGARWLGWDSTTGENPVPPDVRNLPLPWEEITAVPRKYGFHATIKPPFRLAQGTDIDALTSSFVEHCGLHAPVMIEGLSLVTLGRFLALVPIGETRDLAALAAASIRELDRFRAPASQEELAKRRATGLTPVQDAMLRKWGYPYVMEAFRFHMTLTGKLPKAVLPAVTNALETHVLPHVPRPVCIDALSLMGEDEAGRFHLVHRAALSG